MCITTKMNNRALIIVAFCGICIQFVISQLDGYVPGQDYPIYSEIPKGLSFRCDQRLPGYYSDPEAQCQVWHWCLPSGQQFSFLCPNGTIFNQFARVCDWWFNVDCANTPSMYHINEDLYIVPPRSSNVQLQQQQQPQPQPQPQQQQQQRRRRRHHQY